MDKQFYYYDNETGLVYIKLKKIISCINKEYELCNL